MGCQSCTDIVSSINRVPIGMRRTSKSLLARVLQGSSEQACAPAYSVSFQFQTFDPTLANVPVVPNFAIAPNQSNPGCRSDATVRRFWRRLNFHGGSGLSMAHSPRLFRRASSCASKYSASRSNEYCSSTQAQPFTAISSSMLRVARRGVLTEPALDAPLR